jgi:eukaryotic-like serine/threonine-protein kinase
MTAKDPVERPSAAEVALSARLLASTLPGDDAAGPVATRTMTTVLAPTAPHIEKLPDDDDDHAQPPPAVALSWRAWAFHPLVLTAAIVLLVCAGGLLAGRVSSDAPKPVTVPKVTGLRAADATTALERAGLRVQVRERNVADTTKGRITAQVPAAGDTLQPGATVTLTAATGEVVVRAADYVGLPYTKAAAALAKLGLDVRRGVNPDAPSTSITTAVAPVGTVAVGRTVVVDVVAPPVAPLVTGDDEVTRNGNGNGNGKGNGDGKGKKNKKNGG